ncbi:uncharacterized protein LOC116264675 [Nymphaea colorata]|nr:uncharacterized protein LOC116264675 [Nymphaea colorata]
MADTIAQKPCVQPSSGFCPATGKKMAGHSDAGRGVCPSTEASAGNPIAADSHDKENCTAGGVRICSRRRSPLPSWYHRTPLRDVTAIVRAMESRKHEKKSLSAVNSPVGEIADEGIGEASPVSKVSTWSSPCTPVSSSSPLHIFVDEATPVAATGRRYSVAWMAAQWMIPAAVTSCDDKGCRRSTQELNFGKVKDFPARIAQRSSLMSMR